ncbi:UvrD-helicase domain-containing protein [bacterium]|nr:UvrD-helicase domain-containing protein [bacterium]
MKSKRTKFSEDLNDKQLEGVLATEGPVLVLAGAGSGKTRLLTYKIAYLVLELGIDPGCIFGVTFTNKAAGEMRDRVEMLCGGSLGGMWLGTFHSLCGRILRVDGSKIGLGTNYSIYDELDQRRLMKEVINDFGLDPKVHDPKSILNVISGFKNRLISAEDFVPSSVREKTLAKLWTAYQDAMKANNAVDFDDMILFAVRLLQEHEVVRKKYAGRFQYILVDEFQDTNHAQYELIKCLSSEYGNITVVGDDDQSIYSWRGAEVRNILEFPEDFPGAKTIRLEQNYRSSGTILSAASAVVANNSERHEKTLWTDGDKGDKLKLFKLPDEYAEAKLVARSIKKELDSGASGDGIAILYRINAHSRLLEEALTKLQIPHVIIGGIRFFERAEIKDIMGYLRMIVNPDDDISFSRVVNMPRRGVGLKSMSRLKNVGKANGENLYDILLKGNLSDFTPMSRKGFAEFLEIVEKLRTASKDSDAGEVIAQTMRESGYLGMLEKDGSLEARARLENLSELVNSGIEFANTHPEDPSLSAYIIEASLLSGVDEYQPDEETVSLMTVHSAKGLEFDSVYICGLEEGLFPIGRSMESNSEIEEERRLFYVAVTRAREKVSFLWASSRHRFGEEQIGVQSRFVDEIPDELLSSDNEPSQSGGFIRTRSLKKTEKAKSGAINPGTVVEHPFFGRGQVMAIKGWGENAVLTVAFPKYGTKKLLLKYADLSIIR